MQAAVLKAPLQQPANRYAATIDASKRVRWEIDRDVIRGRKFDMGKHFLPDSLSKVTQLTFLRPNEMRFLSQIQGRTYANIFGLVERVVAANTMAATKDHLLGDQLAFEALIRFTDEELKHQALFRRIEEMLAPEMPAGYTFAHDANAVANAVLSKSSWSVLGLILGIEIVTQAHYRSSIEPDGNLSELWKDVFLFHWKEESQHAILDELEWRREDAKLDDAARDRGVDDLIALVGAVDGLLVAQASADAEYFIARAGRAFSSAEAKAIHDGVLKAYRYQHIVTTVSEPRYTKALSELVTPAQMARIGAALQPIVLHQSV
jgi:hypothetical protein